MLSMKLSLQTCWSRWYWFEILYYYSLSLHIVKWLLVSVNIYNLSVLDFLLSFFLLLIIYCYFFHSFFYAHTHEKQTVINCWKWYNNRHCKILWIKYLKQKDFLSIDEIRLWPMPSRWIFPILTTIWTTKNTKNINPNLKAVQQSLT